MSKTFADLFRHACCESAASAADREKQQDARHRELDQQISGLYQDLLIQLKESSRQTLYDLEEAINLRQALEAESIYRQGMNDGLCLLNWFQNDSPGRRI